MGTNRAVLAVAGVVVLGIVAWLAFGFFGIQSAFIDNEVDEAGPEFGSDEEQAEFDDAMDEAADNTSTVDEEVDDDMEEAEVVTLFEGSFAGVSRYTITGEALVLNDGSEQRFLRFENFESDNGPDLNVYLRADDGEFVDLGDLKGNIGDQNYEIPTDVDLDRFNTVQVWCVRFDVEFGNAPLSA